MNLKKYFSDEPYGAKVEFARHFGITPTWLSLLISGKRKPSATLAKRIERDTRKAVTAKELRPDLFE